MADVTAAGLLRGFEGFSPTAYYDKNAWRIGFGSDTMTDANGNIVRVTQDSTTTQEDAERDLARRIPEFQKNGIIPYVGQANWDRLPEATKAAITSTAYNYGSLSKLTSLTKAIKAGDSDAMAAALKKYSTHNDGVNAKRRVAEANIVSSNPIPKVGMATDATLKLQDIQDRNAAARGFGALPPTPANISPALQAARTRLATARQQMKDTTAAGMTPAAKLQIGMNSGASRLTDPLKVGAAGLTATPRLPEGDYTGNVTTNAVQQKAATSSLPKMDVSPIQSRAIILDEGLGSLMNPRSVSPSTPNPVKPPVAGLKVPTGATVDPIGSGASLADLKAFTNPVPAVFKTGQGVAGTVQMPAGVRPSALPPPPAESPLFAPATKPSAGNTLSAPGAGLSAAQKAAISGTGAPIPATRPAGLGAALAPPIPATMPPGLREQGNALPKPTITVKPAAPAAPAQQKLFQSGGYVYSANPAGGYLKIGKMVNGSPVLSGTGSTTAAKSSGTSSGSSTGSQSTAGLKPGDRRYNADTNEWEIK